MRNICLSAALVTGLMLHGAFACELNREASQPGPGIAFQGCSGPDCLVNLTQDPLAAVAKGTSADPVRDCGAGYFDPGTYSGSNGLLDWLVASIDAQREYKSGVGFARSPMDANAQYR